MILDVVTEQIKTNSDDEVIITKVVESSLDEVEVNLRTMVIAI